jgi:hypothetical protein
MIKDLYFIYENQIWLDLAKSSNEWLPLWLQTKIPYKKKPLTWDVYIRDVFLQGEMVYMVLKWVWKVVWKHH